jgi:hypothetical protein
VKPCVRTQSPGEKGPGAAGRPRRVRFHRCARHRDVAPRWPVRLTLPRAYDSAPCRPCGPCPRCPRRWRSRCRARGPGVRGRRPRRPRRAAAPRPVRPRARSSRGRRVRQGQEDRPHRQGEGSRGADGAGAGRTAMRGAERRRPEAATTARPPRGRAEARRVRSAR